MKSFKLKKKYSQLKPQKGGYFHFIQQPFYLKISDTYSLNTQFRYVMKTLECYLINQVFAIEGQEENEFTREVFKNICEVTKETAGEETSDFWIDKYFDVVKGLKDDLIDYVPLEYRKFSNLLSKQTLSALYSIKKSLLAPNIFHMNLNQTLPDESIQYITNKKTIQPYLEEIITELETEGGIPFGKIVRYSNFVYLFPKNEIIRRVLEIFHEIGLNKIKTKTIKEIDLKDPFQKDKWYETSRINSIADLIGITLSVFRDTRLEKFAEEMMEKLVNIYNNNPSVDCALILAKLGIPEFPFNKVLDPPPNPKLRMTPEEAEELKPLLGFLLKLEEFYEKDCEDFFIKYFDRIIEKNADLKKKLVQFKKVNVVLPGNTFQIYVDSTDEIYNVKLMIIDHISEHISKIFTKHKQNLIRDPLKVEEINLLFKHMGKIVVMEDERSINDYNLMGIDEPTITVSVKIKSGFKITL